MDLLEWSEVTSKREWSGILIGNGASIAVWPDFAYDSLYERATSRSIPHPLEPEDIQILSALGTTNFEFALASIKTSRTVLRALEQKTDYLKYRYEHIQRSLFEAVHSVHLPWGITLGVEATQKAIRAEIRSYAWVYSTNYDLILYWAVMSEESGRGIVDFFWNDGRVFNPHDTEPPSYVPEGSTRIVWLHGGLHIRRGTDGRIFKETASSDNLLEKFRTSFSSDATPLLVSEGTADDKFRAINRASYLDFGLRSLARHASGLVIFGCSLRPEDQHLVRAVNERQSSELAIAIRRTSDPSDVIQRKAELRALFPRAEIYFFDSASHPLGNPDLRVVRPKIGIKRDSVL